MRCEWIQRPTNGTAIIFVHGVLSSGAASWSHPNGCYWPSLVAESAPEAGVYVFSYRTNVFSGTYRLGDAVDSLKEQMRLDGLFDCHTLVFVAHSMGGLVVRKLIVERQTDFRRGRISIGLFLVASPSLGSRYANLLEALARAVGHTQADALRFSQTNTWLLDLDKDFRNLKEAGELQLVGKELIEDRFVAVRHLIRTQVVEPFSGARYFGESFKVPGSDHFTIAAPGSSQAIQHRLLLRFVQDLPAPALNARPEVLRRDPSGAEEGERFYNKIFFCDLIGYSALDPSDQYDAQRALNGVMTDALATLGCRLEEDVLALPTGVGLILNFLHAAPDIHLRTALLALEGLHSSQRPIGLRVGLNSFFDRWVRDINGKKNVVGAGVNMAQRVLEFGHHGQILMHDRVRADLLDFAGYAGRILFRGNFRMSDGAEVPISQFVDPSKPWIASDLAESPPSQVALDFDDLLEKRVQDNVLTLRLDRRAKDNIALIQEYIQGCVDDIGALQRLKFAAGWVVGELIENVFQHAKKDESSQNFDLNLSRTRGGLLISILQDRWTPFDLAEVLERPRRGSFMQMMHDRGLVWHQRIVEGRHELGLELPSDLDLRPRWSSNFEPRRSGDDAELSAQIVLAEAPFGRVDMDSSQRFTEWLDGAVAAARAENAVLVLDLSQLDYVSSAGLRALMVARRGAGADTPIVLAALRPLVAEILAISRFDMVFKVYFDVDSALAAFGRKLVRTLR